MKSQIVNVEGRELSLSHLDKVFYPEGGFTKGQVIDYYARIAPVLLPHLKDRPVTLKRYPDGVEGKFFYEKRAPKYRPKWLKTTAVASRRDPTGEINYCLINDLPSLIWAANMGNLELHTFLAKRQNIEQPTQIIFDLDPGPPADVRDCAEISLRIKEFLEKIKLVCLVKSSGSKGLQIHIPLNTPASFEMTKSFARVLAISMHRAYPDRVVHDMKKNLREGKVLIDWSQNDSAKTTVNVYSLRARQHPFVASPLHWDEVRRYAENGDSKSFFLESEEVLSRVRKEGDLFVNLLRLKQKLPTKWADRIEEIDPGEAKSNAKRPPASRQPREPHNITEAEALKKAHPEAPEQIRPQTANVASLSRKFVEPMKCLPAKVIPAGEDWLYELKFDGFRALAICREGDAILLSRNRTNLTSRFASLATILRQLPVKEAVLDGEIVAFDEDNRPSFETLQGFQEGNPLAYYVFDLISVNDEDWKGRPLIERRRRLKSILRDAGSPIFFSGELNGDAQVIWAEIQKRGLEGLIAKRKSSLYEPGKRTGQWVKIKAVVRHEFVIGGYTQPKGGRSHFGALLLGTFEADGFRFCGRAGTGFKESMLSTLRERMDALRTPESPFSNLRELRAARTYAGMTISDWKNCVWIKPELVCEIRFTAWTEEGLLRNPSFMGLREDLSAADVHAVRAKE
jgi:bifunctional non-homologous end joining protein LigD